MVICGISHFRRCPSNPSPPILQQIDINFTNITLALKSTLSCKVLLAENGPRGGKPMRIFLIVAITVTMLGGYAFSHIVSELQGAAQPTSSANNKPETPFFCDRTALRRDQRKRQQELGKTLRSSVLGIQELPDGFEFEFPYDPSNYQALTEFTPLKRACCPFFDISIRLA